MTTIELRFPANRYHGTGWGRHVNEGVPEWPPSPYRLLRAMYDVWKRKRPDLDEAEVRSLFTTLSETLPKFYLDKVVASHTRSYMSRNTTDHAEKTLIFDAFVALSPESCCSLEWDINLRDCEKQLLESLLSGLNYLGRSESWIKAQLGNRRGPILCKPVDGIPQESVIYLACPLEPAAYSGKRAWFDALAYSSNEVVKERLSGPPAMRSVPYELPVNAVATWLPVRPVPSNRLISAAIVELSGRVLPVATDSVRISERIRGRLMRIFERSGQTIPAIVHGKDAASRPLTDHSHLFIVPRSNARGRIDSVLLFSTNNGGFSHELTDAIANLHSVHWIESLRATLAWMGSHQDEGIRPRVKAATSMTPFITVRHWRKGRGSVTEFLQNELRRECSNHGLPEPAVITPTDRAGRLFSPIQFRRNREGDPVRPGYAFQLEFSEPVPVPFTLGYGCHFGLGQFDKLSR